MGVLPTMTSNRRPLTFHSTSPPKRALLSVSTASSVVAAPPGPSAGLVVVQASRQPRCGFGERGDGHQADEQASKDQGRGKGRYRRYEQAEGQERARTRTSQCAGTVPL